MARFDSDDGGDDGSARWLTTYGDAMTLLLVFFVLLLSMSTIDPQTFKIVVSSFKGAIGVLESGRTLSPEELMDQGLDVQKLSRDQTTVAHHVPREARERLKENLREASIRHDERGLVIQITDRVLFDPGEVQLRAQGRDFLRNVGEFLTAPRVRGRMVRVEGHTDDSVPSPPSSNWHISVLRSANVVEFLHSATDVQEERLGAAGYGPTRPVDTNETASGRRRNRRVEIVLLKPKPTRSLP